MLKNIYIYIYIHLNTERAIEIGVTGPIHAPLRYLRQVLPDAHDEETLAELRQPVARVDHAPAHLDTNQERLGQSVCVCMYRYR